MFLGAVEIAGLSGHAWPGVRGTGAGAGPMMIRRGTMSGPLAKGRRISAAVRVVFRGLRGRSLPK
ncbi:hypothetical protein AMK34_30825 [Amycolatopsis sp. CB00013]|nr:hypothetical protein AMK34_30825 [Amycolatopsis sp. CB00013]